MNTEITQQAFKQQLNKIHPGEQYKILFELLHNVCQENTWGDPFSYARSREIYMAIDLGHTIASTYSGEDAYTINEGGKKIKYEYKSTISPSINGTYNGISVKDTIEDQINYVINEKIGCYKTHYYSRFSEGKIVETWAVDGATVLTLLLPKIKKQYISYTTSKKKKADPRIGVTMTNTEITTHGTRIK